MRRVLHALKNNQKNRQIQVIARVDYAHCDPKVTEIVSVSCYF